MGKKIRSIFGRAAEPFKALNRWARKPKGFGSRITRFKQLRTWARKKREQVKGKARIAWESRRKGYRKKVRYLKKAQDKRAEVRVGGSEIGSFDGKAVAADWVPILKAARASGLWWGSLLSGYRDPAYSEQLCYNICDRPSCPGLCAGRASNHSKSTIAAGAAVDVTDHIGFARALAAIGHSELHNAIGPSDPNHFSITGR